MTIKVKYDSESTLARRIRMQVPRITVAQSIKMARAQIAARRRNEKRAKKK